MAKGNPKCTCHFGNGIHHPICPLYIIKKGSK